MAADDRPRAVSTEPTSRPSAARASRGCCAASPARARCPASARASPTCACTSTCGSARSRSTAGGRSRPSCGSSRRAGHLGREGRRALLQGARGRGRRQGPRRPEERRHLGVLRLGHRVLRRQDRARLRPPDRSCSAPITTATSRACETRWRRSACPQERFEALLYQLVFITKGGEAVKMGKRAGNIVTIDEVMDEIDEAAAAQGRRRRRAALLLPLAERELERRVRHRAGEEVVARQPGLLRPVRLRAPPLDPAQGPHSRPRGAARGAVPAPRRSRSSFTPTSSRCARSSAISRTWSPRPRARASRTALSSTSRSLRATFRVTSRASRARATPILPPAQRARGRRAGSASWDLEKTRARLAWIEAIRDDVRAGARATSASARPSAWSGRSDADPAVSEPEAGRTREAWTPDKLCTRRAPRLRTVYEAATNDRHARTGIDPKPRAPSRGRRRARGCRAA